jgi:hypothetical protein
MRLEEIRQSDSHVDITGSVEVYQTGKTFDCECGHGIGTEHDKGAVVCFNCNRVCVDRKSGDREAPKTEKEQATLAQF